MGAASYSVISGRDALRLSTPIAFRLPNRELSVYKNNLNITQAAQIKYKAKGSIFPHNNRPQQNKPHPLTQS